ncbi:MAG: DVU_1557 family redox protein [Thermodesulfobacteriota bacterium]
MDWVCQRCDRALEPGKVEVAYQGSVFPADLYRCPGCGQVFVPEDLALGKMAEIEELLEGK